MVKKKGKSKRISLKDKYKIERRVAETNRKRRKQAKKDARDGKVQQKKRDPGIPNSWPFKQDLLKEIRRARDRQQQIQSEAKDRRKNELRELRKHQEAGGTARTVQELMERANQDQQDFQVKQGQQQLEQDTDPNAPSGQQSRRAYLKDLKKVVDSADVLLQVLDARDPTGSRIHPSVENAILSRADKKMVLVLNKIDLIPKSAVTEWLNVLRRSHPTIAIKASPQHDRTSEKGADAATSNVPVGMDGLLQLLKNYSRTGGSDSRSKTTIVVGVIGYPNVGKSSIINALKRSRAVGVSPRPGFTTSLQEVVLDRNVRLLDSPGVVFDDKSAMLGNCVDADSIEDPITPVAALLTRCNPSSLIMAYNIPAFPPGDVMMFLAMVAKSYGRVLKGGIPNKEAAARAVLRDWNSGKIPYYTAPPKTTPNTEGAVVVSKFSAEFDLAKLDEQVIKTLKDSDEMDFVELADERTDEVGESAKEAINFLTGTRDDAMEDEDEDDEESSEEEEDAMEEDTPAKVNLAKLAAAEDYNFDEM